MPPDPMPSKVQQEIALRRARDDYPLATWKTGVDAVLCTCCGEQETRSADAVCVWCRSDLIETQAHNHRELNATSWQERWPDKYAEGWQ